MLNIDHLDNQMSIANIREIYGLSKKQIADRLGITLQDLAIYEADPDEMPMSIVRKMTDIQQEFKEKRNIFHYTNPYPELRAKFQHNKQRLIHELNQVNVSETSKKIFIEDILVHQQYYDRKPRIGVFGGFDAGKSSLCNILLEGDYLPVGYQPMTSIACILRHIDDKPTWQSGQVLMLDAEFNMREIDDAEYCQQHRLFDTHLEFFKQMTHQTIQEIVHYAIVYLDAPILRCCDLVDIPGYGNNDQDTSIADNMVYDIDVILYLSKLDGFLGQEQIQPLYDLLSVNDMIYGEDLDKLYIILTHADGVDLQQGSMQHVFDNILDKSAKRIYQAFKEEYNRFTAEFPFFNKVHKILSKKLLKEKDFRTRFFTFSAINSNLRLGFEHDLENLLNHKLPKYMRHKFYKEIRLLESEPEQSFLTGLEKLKKMSLTNDEFYEKEQDQRIQRMVDMVKMIRTYREKTSQDVTKFIWDSVSQKSLEHLILGYSMSRENVYQMTAGIILSAVDDYMINTLNHYADLFSSQFTQKIRKITIKTNTSISISENTYKYTFSFRKWYEIAAEDIYEQFEEKKYEKIVINFIEKYWSDQFEIVKRDLIENETRAYQLLSDTIANYK